MLITDKQMISIKRLKLPSQGLRKQSLTCPDLRFVRCGPSGLVRNVKGLQSEPQGLFVGRLLWPTSPRTISETVPCGCTRSYLSVLPGCVHPVTAAVPDRGELNYANFKALAPDPHTGSIVIRTGLDASGRPLVTQPIGIYKPVSH